MESKDAVKTDAVKLPKAVYYQCMWVVKDMDRLTSLEFMLKHGRRNDEVVFYEEEECSVMRDEVMEEASRKLSCIREALLKIPEEYRFETVESISDGVYPIGIAHENTWKKWRREFIKELALKLNLI